MKLKQSPKERMLDGVAYIIAKFFEILMLLAVIGGLCGFALFALHSYATIPEARGGCLFWLGLGIFAFATISAFRLWVWSLERLDKRTLLIKAEQLKAAQQEQPNHE